MDNADSDTAVNFRLLPAYRKHKRRSVTQRKIAVCDDRTDTMSQDGGQLLPAEVEIASAKDTPSISSSSSSSLLSLTKPPEQAARMSNRKWQCAELCKRVAGFLLSTVGLTLLTVAYAIAGGYLFSALESHNEQTVKTAVGAALQWHIDALWNNTAALNVLHPVSIAARTLLLYLVYTMM